jgi:hypothetical protein
MHVQAVEVNKIEVRVQPITAADVSEVLPAREVATYLAVASTQGGRQQYTLVMTLVDVPRLLPVPDPERPTPGNRRVHVTHARDFGRYIRERDSWVAPPLLLRDASSVTFEVITELAGGSQLGYARVPVGAAESLKIIDGQHRILGIDLLLRDVRQALDTARERHAAAEFAGDAAEAERWVAEVDALEATLDRLTRESISVVIYKESVPQRYEQMFFDVADNALGISQAIKVRFDSTKIINRVLDQVAQHRLLAGRVDQENDRVVRQNPNLLGAKHITDIVRAVNVGVVGRIGRNREKEFEEAALIENTYAFLDALTDGFPDLAAVADGDLAPPELRRQSLLGSVTMLRVLAGVFYNLSDRTGAAVGLDAMDDDQVTDFFAALAPHMPAPVQADSIWKKDKTTSEHFDVGTFGPLARSQNLKGLAKSLTKWAHDGRLQRQT